MLEINDIDKRLSEIPAQIQQLESERNQLLGYKQAIIDRLDAKEKADESKKDKK
tara:strand:+ start:1922 stop:2083 length:162 start_codon:yes stop_codon:yes gene_type:complete